MTPDKSISDARLYSPYADVKIAIGTGARDSCFDKHPGEDFFHRIVRGEVYVTTQGGEKYCLNCAVRRKLLTDDRMFWQGTSSDRSV